MLDADARSQLESILGHHFAQASLLDLAMTHSSVTESGLDSNERLEFLGDAVLGMITCDLLFQRFPESREGELTKIKSLTVSRETCARLARTLGIERLLVVGKGMMGTRELPPSLAACALESVLGALYLDGGMEAARRFIEAHLRAEIEAGAASGHQRNFKSLLQQHCQQAEGSSPIYRILDEQGPDHAKCFKIAVEIDGRRFSPCWGQTKKRAEQDAACIALRELGVLSEHDAAT